MPCVYGESRKFGRPPRQPVPKRTTGSTSPTSSGRSSEQPEERATRATAAVLAPEPDQPGASSTVSHNGDDVWGGIAESNSANVGMIDFASIEDGLHHDLNFIGADPLHSGFVDWAASESYWADNALPEEPEHDRASSNASHTPESSRPGSASMVLSGTGDHDCLRDAYEILGNLSNLNISKGHFGSPLETTPQTPTQSVPLDHVLRINREASERLGQLLLCTCDRSPHLQLLYASIISRVLIWYQQVTDCTSHHDRVVSWSSSSYLPPAITLDDFSVTAMAPSSLASSNAAAPTAPSGPVPSPGGSNVGTTRAAAPLAIGPSSMAIGTFNVDDLGMQAALKIQLLSGEMRRAGWLIDLFTSFHHGGGQCMADMSSPGFGGESNLYQILDSWLRGEHLRVTNLMRSKLRELNADLL
ncbi:uncharacterized protein C8A04DRAFT_24198 [Dichotomopilus funicola]|uniref:Aflatoxin regulatory protein domain-containing protein n=1 Tax=Dichotomopilus funicola TaxID=1934379 RepID=A0AAN6ZSP1_9PEZI|nr:hypothetical protein C8A04DRAFT_24198 [Dichotomopilus funicola]